MKMQVLIVDDEPTSREVIRQGVERNDCDTMEAVDAVSAIDLLSEQQFHIIITDKNMPGTDHPTEGGLDVLKFAKSSNPACAVLMVTAYASVETAIEAMKMGAFDYITKPITSDKIKAKLERIIIYLQTLDPAKTLNAYSNFRDNFLGILQQEGADQNLSEETKTLLLEAVQEKIDSFFHERRAWENIILEQRDALSRIAGCAEQFKDSMPADSEKKELIKTIIAEANRRL